MPPDSIGSIQLRKIDKRQTEMMFFGIVVHQRRQTSQEFSDWVTASSGEAADQILAVQNAQRLIELENYCNHIRGKQEIVFNRLIQRLNNDIAEITAAQTSHIPPRAEMKDTIPTAAQEISVPLPQPRKRPTTDMRWANYYSGNSVSG